MSEPALTNDQSELLISLFIRRIRAHCHCVNNATYVCVRCKDIARIKNAFPGTYVAACVRAADKPNG